MTIALNTRFTFDVEDREVIAAHILGRVAEGVTLASICRDPTMPGIHSVTQWLASDEAFAASYARAKAMGLDAIAERARQTLRGKTTEEGGDSTNDIIRDKAIADLDMKLLGKWDPKRYGDAVQLRHADADGEKLDTAPLVNEVMGIMRAARKALDGPAEDGG